LASIYLFFENKYYAESILYFYYVLIGIYGWQRWSKNDDSVLKVKTVGRLFHILAVLGGVISSYLLGITLQKYTDDGRPFADATSTIFSFIASYMEAHKILTTWIFWIVINLFSIWLYLDRGLKMYSGLMVIYFLLSVAGYIQWRHSYENPEETDEVVIT